MANPSGSENAKIQKIVNRHDNDILEEELFKTTISHRKRRNRPSTPHTTTPTFVTTSKATPIFFIEARTTSSEDLPSKIRIKTTKKPTITNTIERNDIEIPSEVDNIEVEPSTDSENNGENGGETFRKASFFPEINRNCSVLLSTSFFLHLFVVLVLFFNN